MCQCVTKSCERRSLLRKPRRSLPHYFLKSRKSVVLGVLFALALALSVLVHNRRRMDTREVWFEDIQNPLPITAADGQALVRFTAMAILRQKVVSSLPAPLRDDNLPRIVFLSLSDGSTPAHVVLGSGIGVSNAIEQAVSGAYTLLDTGYQPLWVKVDVVQEVISLDHLNFDQPLDLERSLHGLAFDRQSSWTVISMFGQITSSRTWRDTPLVGKSTNGF